MAYPLRVYPEVVFVGEAPPEVPRHLRQLEVVGEVRHTLQHHNLGGEWGTNECVVTSCDMIECVVMYDMVYYRSIQGTFN